MDKNQRIGLNRVYDLRFWAGFTQSQKRLLHRLESELIPNIPPFAEWLESKARWQQLYEQQGSAAAIEKMGDFLLDARWVQDGDERFDLSLSEYEQIVTQQQYQGNGHETNALLLLALAARLIESKT